MAENVTLSRAELEALCAVAAEKGAKQAVAAFLGVHPEDPCVATDFQDLREMLAAYRDMKHGMFRGAGKILLIGAFIGLVMLASKFHAINWSIFSS